MLSLGTLTLVFFGELAIEDAIDVVLDEHREFLRECLGVWIYAGFIMLGVLKGRGVGGLLTFGFGL